MNAADEPLNQHDESEHTVGVGPWEGPHPIEAHFDPELLREGDRRNVIDEYRYWSMDAIIADLDKKRFSFHIAIENLEHDMNIGSIVRSANAFMAKEVHIIGKRRWNRRGAMVTDRYQHVNHHEDISAFAAWAKSQNLEIIGIDNLPGSVPIETYDLPRECVLLFGQEGRGLSPEAGELVTSCLSIAQFGSTRSINAGAAAAIAMHAWIRRHVFNQNVK
jgi:tRNA G18 (ribose-2'-O)-methylase SpoU